jgi:hypothetical protein
MQVCEYIHACRWAMKRDEALADVLKMKEELDRRDEIITKHRKLIGEYQRVRSVCMRVNIDK